MNFLRVPEVSLRGVGPLDVVMDRLERHLLAHAPWERYPYKPQVHFTIAHDVQHVFLKFYVREKFLRIAVLQTNGPVWEDSCVELFISFGEEGYYNIETNAAGIIHAAFGKTRENRSLLDEMQSNTITRNLNIRNEGTEYHWTVTLKIPVSVFVHHQQIKLNGLRCRANFFKCGDAQPQPHYVYWNLVASVEPDFHLPQYFGTLQFE